MDAGEWVKLAEWCCFELGGVPDDGRYSVCGWTLCRAELQPNMEGFPYCNVQILLHLADMPFSIFCHGTYVQHLDTIIRHIQ